MGFAVVSVGDLVEQHAREAALLWSQRDFGVTSPDYDLDDLANVDEQLAAHLDGLRIAGAMGWRKAHTVLAEEVEAGEAFVAAKVALDRMDVRAFALVIDQLDADPELWRGIPSAIGFCEWDAVDKVLQALVAADNPPVLAKVGIAGYAVHRRDPGDALDRALRSSDRPLRLRGLRAAAAMGATRVMDTLADAARGEDAEARYWASRSMVLLGEGGMKTLQRAAAEGGPYAEDAAWLAGALMDASAVASWVAQLEHAGHGREALLAAASSGQPSLLPWVVEQMKDEALARLAGFAWYAIGGVPIEDELETEEPEVDEEQDDLDEAPDTIDEDLAWPHPEVATARLGALTASLGTDRRLIGRPLDAPWLETVLRDGPQPLRQVVAWLRHRDGVDAQPFPVKAPAWRQRGALPARPPGSETLGLS